MSKNAEGDQVDFQNSQVHGDYKRHAYTDTRPPFAGCYYKMYVI